jgi:hypothetical protein
MALSDRLVNELQVKLVGSTINLLRLEIWNMLNDFCRESWAWRETIQTTLTAGEDTYAITPVGTEIVAALSVDHDTLDLTGVAYEFGTITLYTAPSAADVAAGDLNTVVALAPAINTGSDIENLIPADMWSKHHKAFVNGVLAMMMVQPAKPYSNPQLAAYHQRVYKAECAVARRAAETGDVRNAQLWRFPGFGR